MARLCSKRGLLEEGTQRHVKFFFSDHPVKQYSHTILGLITRTDGKNFCSYEDSCQYNNSRLDRTVNHVRIDHFMEKVHCIALCYISG